MADTKISALPAVSAVAGTNEFAVNEAGTSKKATAAQIATYLGPARNFSTASQTISANTVTYLTGSGIEIPATGFVAGQLYRWYIGVSKTAAGTATPIWTFRVGTNQTTGDATVLTITGTAQVGTLSGTNIVINALIRSVHASTGIIVGSINTGAASFGIGGNVVSGNLNNASDAGKFFGLCVNTGASAAWTVNSVLGELT